MGREQKIQKVYLSPCKPHHPSAHRILGPLEIRPAAGPTTRYNMGTGQIRPTPFADNPAMTTIEQAGAELLRAMDLLTEQQAVVARAKAQVMELMTDAGVKTVKLPTAQIQVVETPVWEYRDRGVTAARVDVEKAEKVVKGVKAVLKGAEGAAKAAGGARARVTETKVAVRVVGANAVSGGGMI